MFFKRYKKLIAELSIKLENAVNENTDIQHELKEVKSHNEGLLNILEEYKSELKVLEFYREKNSELMEDIKNYKQEVKDYSEIHDTIITILLSSDKAKIKELIKAKGVTEIFSVNKLTDGKYDVTIGFNTFGEDVCTKEFNNHLDAYKFATIRALLRYDIKSY